ncbi:MAG: efflux RND transporter periplasmic adaptor subunit [Cyclobacteriaceae bacterium]|nr:efflux RND transporter periplasmic adaptor subunit [Cyclobacteriaceae bacterium]
MKWILLIVMLPMACRQISTSEETTVSGLHAGHELKQVMLTDAQVLLGNIKTRKVGLLPLVESKTVNARLVTNTETTFAVSSRINGRVERLFIKESGKPVKAGEPLYQLYSEELLALQQTYLLATADTANNLDSYVAKATHKKLQLYGLTEMQLDQLIKNGRPDARITCYAPAAGIVSSIAVSEGQYVAEGSPLYSLVNLNKLWVEADIYTQESLQVGDPVTVQVAGYPAIESRLEFVAPEFNAASQTWRVRTSIVNPGNLKPGMPAMVRAYTRAESTVVIPAQAVIRTGQGPHLYVETAPNTFQPRMVKTGIETSAEVQVLDGVHEGETVAISGAYLLYSEFILKHGVNPVHQH